MSYPKWIPYPGAFLYVLLFLALLLIETSFIYPILWLVTSVTGAATFIADASIESFNILMSYAVVVLLGVFVITWILALEYQLVRFMAQAIAKKKTTKLSFIPPVKCWKDAIFGLCALSAIVGFLFIASSLSHCYLIECDDQSRSMDELRAEMEIRMFALWITVFMVYAYHLRMLRRERLERKRKKRNIQANKKNLPRMKRPSKSRTVVNQPKSSVDTELEELKRRMRDEG